LTSPAGLPNSLSRTVDVAALEFLAVVLSARGVPRLVQISAAENIAPVVRLAGEDHADSGAGDWLGFYDWLRDSAGEVIGVQQWIDEAASYPFSKCFVGVQPDLDSLCVRIFFGQSREVDGALSCDQDFGSNRLLVADDSIALTFNAPVTLSPSP
jgi:hypothetical protein